MTVGVKQKEIMEGTSPAMHAVGKHGLKPNFDIINELLETSQNLILQVKHDR